MTTVTVTDVVDRCGVPDDISWGDPITLSYDYDHSRGRDGAVTISLPRNGTGLAVSGPSFDAICTVLNGQPDLNVLHQAGWANESL